MQGKNNERHKMTHEKDIILFPKINAWTLLAWKYKLLVILDVCKALGKNGVRALYRKLHQVKAISLINTRSQRNPYLLLK